MKKSILALGILTLAIGMGTTAPAAANAEYSVQDKVQLLQNKLSLTEDQVSQIRPIVQSCHENMTREMNQKDRQIEALLTSEQREKYRGMQEDMKEKMNRAMEDMKSRSY